MKSLYRVCVSIGLISVGVGLALLIIAASSKTKWYNGASYSFQETYNNVNNIDFHISYGKVYIKEGDSFQIDAKNMVNKNFESYLDNGKWIIRDSGDDAFKLFGIDLSLGYVFHIGNYKEPSFVITVPKGFMADEFKLEFGAGYLEADAIRAKEGSFGVGAGELRINNLEITDHSDYNIGTGEMYLGQTNVNNINLDCGMGYTKISGIITGDNDISCGVGSIDMDIDGDSDDYSYKVDNGIGHISINDESYRKFMRNRRNSQADNNMNIDCGIGKIALDFD